MSLFFRPSDISYPTIQTERTFNTTDYANEPRLTRINDTTLVSVIRRGGGHISNDGRLIAHRSTDNGQTWDSGTVISENGSYDERNACVIYDGSDNRLTVLYRRYDAANSTHIDERVVRSTDGGQSWTTPADFSDWTISTVLPFDGGTKSSQGFVAMAHNNNGVVEALFSTDGGQSWGSPTTVVDTSGDSNHETAEPSPLAMPSDNSQVLVLGRDVAGNGAWAAKSTDGGQTWGSPTYFDQAYGNNPLQHAVVNGGDDVVVTWGDRTPQAGQIRLALKPASDLWSDPTILEGEAEAAVSMSNAWRNDDGTGRDFGYPSVVAGGDSVDSTLIQWYDYDADTNVDTDILQATYDHALTETVVDDYEDQDLTEYSGDTSDYQFVQQDYHGTYAIENTANGVGIASTSGLSAYPSQGDIFEYYIRFTSDNSESYLTFGAQSETVQPDGYEIGARNGRSDLFLRERNGGSTTTHMSRSNEYTTGDWYAIRVMWVGDGDIAVVAHNLTTGKDEEFVYDRNNTTFSSGGIAMFLARNTGTVEPTQVGGIRITNSVV